MNDVLTTNFPAVLTRRAFHQAALDEARRKHHDDIRSAKRAADGLEEKLSQERAQRKEVEAALQAAERYAVTKHACWCNVL